MWTIAFWKDTAERAIKTFAQVFSVFITAGVTGLLDVEWLVALSIAGGATLFSVLTSVASAPASTPGTASIVNVIRYDPVQTTE